MCGLGHTLRKALEPYTITLLFPFFLFNVGLSTLDGYFSIGLSPTSLLS